MKMVIKHKFRCREFENFTRASSRPSFSFDNLLEVDNNWEHPEIKPLKFTSPLVLGL